MLILWAAGSAVGVTGLGGGAHIGLAVGGRVMESAGVIQGAGFDICRFDHHVQGAALAQAMTSSDRSGCPAPAGCSRFLRGEDGIFQMRVHSASLLVTVRV